MNSDTFKSSRDRTTIGEHRRIRNELVPPLMAGKLNGKIELTSWINDRMPEMLWAALIINSLGRDHALVEFRRILHFIGEHKRKEQLHDLTLTGISKVDVKLRSELISQMVQTPRVSRALSAMLFFETLPGHEVWQELLPSVEPDSTLLMNSVGQVLWHQSQEATDCRWLRIMAKGITGKMAVPDNPEWHEKIDQLHEYPHKYDQRKVRPIVRAIEGLLDTLTSPDRTWPRAFWHGGWTKTYCLTSNQQYELHPSTQIVTRGTLSKLREHLEAHWQQTHSTTAMDPKHDAIFGMAFYCLRILDEMLGIRIGNSVLGRLGIRTILEVRINLAYMLEKDTAQLWKEWREYGAGQVKLNALKFDESIDPPQYIDVETIESIASEDIWEELRSINLASWHRLDLRKLSEEAGLKDAYDRHYSWTSGYSHASWGAIREACYQTCLNPLHRLHRYPERRFLNDTVNDAAKLVDKILEHLCDVYPPFRYRLLADTD